MSEKTLREAIEDLLKFLHSLPVHMHEQKINTLDSIIMILVDNDEQIKKHIGMTGK